MVTGALHQHRVLSLLRYSAASSSGKDGAVTGCCDAVVWHELLWQACVLCLRGTSRRRASTFCTVAGDAEVDMTSHAYCLDAVLASTFAKARPPPPPPQCYHTSSMFPAVRCSYSTRRGPFLKLALIDPLNCWFVWLSDQPSIGGLPCVSATHTGRHGCLSVRPYRGASGTHSLNQRQSCPPCHYPGVTATSVTATIPA